MTTKIVNKIIYKFSTAVTSKTFTTSVVDITADTVTIADHGMATGQPVGILASGTIPAGLTEATTGYYIINVDASTVAFATSKANAFAGTKVNITSVGTGTNTIYLNGAGIVDLGLLPNKFVITDCWYDVTTSYLTDDGTTPSNNAGTLALSTGQGVGDLKVAIAVSDGTAVWNSGIHGTLVTGPAFANDAAEDTALEVIALFTACKLKMTADRIALLTFATETATAGAMDLYVEGYQGS